jgi:hypothetical protein
VKASIFVAVYGVAAERLIQRAAITLALPQKSKCSFGGGRLHFRLLRNKQLTSESNEPAIERRIKLGIAIPDAARRWSAFV